MPESTAPATRPDQGPADVKPRKEKKTPVVPKSIAYPFWFGGSASSMAACVTHPLDLVKVRLQLRSGDAPKNMSGTFVHILRREGITGLYQGLTAALLRQMTYSTVRFGVYEEIKRRVVPEGQKPSTFVLIGISSFSGVLGGISGNAADVINVRMQQDGALPAQQRRNYKHSADGLIRMAREEGLARSWFRGVWPNSMRAGLMNAGQLASYDTIKVLLMTHLGMADTTNTHFASSFLAGFVATTICSPVDVIKSRVMSATTKKGIPALLSEIYAKEGATWMFKGWVPAFLRLGPQTIFTFLFLEAHRDAYRKFKGIEN